MYVRINGEEFIEQFEKAGRKNQFSRAALIALFDFFESLEEEIDEQIEVDVIAICCEWSEYKSEAEARAAYDNDELFDSLTKLETWNGGMVVNE